MSEIADRSEEAAAPPEDKPQLLPEAEPQAPEHTVYESPSDPDPVDLDEEPDEDFDDVPGPREETDEEILVPKVDPVERKLWSTNHEGGNLQERTYIQGPFLYFQQFEMYGLLGRATQIVLEGESGLDINEIFDMVQPKRMVDQILRQRSPGYEDAPDTGEDDDEIDANQAAKMLSAFARVIAVSPGLLREAYCIILDVPQAHRKWALEWALPRLSREDGTDILETFIDQNWNVLEGFFTDELPRIAKRAARARARHKSAGRRSKR